RDGMERLYRLFQDAPVLGSLINPRAHKGDLLVAAFDELQPLLEEALAQEVKDDSTHETAVIARGLTKAAEILAQQFTLVATNVPYLGYKKQEPTLKAFCERVHTDAKHDLATCLVERCLSLCTHAGSVALLTPHNWLFLGAYLKLRRRLLKEAQWAFMASLGPKAFQTPMYDFSTVLLSLTNQIPAANHRFIGVDVGGQPSPREKASALCREAGAGFRQKEQLNNPDARIALTEPSRVPILGKVVTCLTGILNGDSPKFQRYFWEFSSRPREWAFQQSTVSTTTPFGGREQLLLFDEQNGHLREDATIRRERLHDSDQRGNSVWGKRGLLVHRMGNLPATLYTGEIFDQNGAAIVPSDKELLAAIWCFVSSEEYARAVRRLDKKVGVTPATLSKVPFDLTRWQEVAAEKFPDGLPRPFSSDPTQWLFNGHPAGAVQPLHVAVARLLGYQWPRQTGSSFPDCPALNPDGLESFADDDGIVCLSATRGEASAAERLRGLLAAALPALDLKQIVATAGPKGSKSETLDEWLRDEFFEQHCMLFHHRPFIWHVWDGLKNGFSALVNYHKLTHTNLEKLTFSYLGDWIRRQQAAVETGQAGSDSRLETAKRLQNRLKLILEGEPPYDLFVRWKPVSKQAIGWHPDLNDGVRINIRPFLAQDLPGAKKGAGVLRTKPNIKWEKDRGKEVYRDKAEYPWCWGWDETTQDFSGVGHEPDSARWNDCHYTIEFKRRASRAR
ncbi:MAG TPA: SAM-dependent DNA methyltransferase, partial [Terriglobales bacterium]|nr:SAM-dependent DNA methyltransferase [Terriglobales bacterium]